MGNFFRTVFASCLGVILATLLMGAISFGIFSSFASSAAKPKPIKANSVLHVKLPEQVPDKTNNTEATSFDLNEEDILGLQDIIGIINRAAEDDDIKGIYLASSFSPLSFASTSALRDAILAFKASGKFVVAYSEFYSQGGYYLATAADQIHINPIGLIDFRGMSSQRAFFTRMLEKVGVKVEVFYAGKYKSATEPFRRVDMSPENREQTRVYVDDMYSILLNEVSESRNIPITSLKSSIDEWVGADANKALDAGLVDFVSHKDRPMSEMKDQIGLDEDDDINFVSLSQYHVSRPAKTNLRIKDKVAVVYAEGTIIDGRSENGTTGSYTYTKIIDEIRESNNIKAMVLRVNSPGGSAMASENIWRSIQRLKEAGKPVVVSMADYAASGGYYIAAPADTIVAQAETITGSIGVFSIFPDVSGLMNEKLGITFDTISTGKLSSGYTGFFPVSEAEAKVLQNRADDLYMKFLERVAEGRNMTVDEVNEIAQGRVWTGTRAQKNGLVDVLGDLETAKEIAANMAGLSDYRIVEYPKVKNPFEQLLDELINPDSGDEVAAKYLKRELKEWYPYYLELKYIKESKGIQMRMMDIVPFR